MLKPFVIDISLQLRGEVLTGRRVRIDEAEKANQIYNMLEEQLLNESQGGVGDVSSTLIEQLLAPKASSIKFTAYPYADISTAYVEESDLNLLSSGECHLAQLDGKEGDFYYVPLPDSRDDQEWAELVATWKEQGLSERFAEIMTELRRQNIAYVRFDCDGADVEGMEPRQ